MPFDVKGFQPYTLTDHLATIGITPVPLAVLQAHKAEQERKHPESVFNKHWPYFLIGTMCSIGMVAVLVMNRSPATITEILVMVAIGLLSAMVATGVTLVMAFWICEKFEIKVLEKAYWLETMGWQYRKMPQPVRRLVERVEASSISGIIVYGELIQNEVILDPYIVVRTPTEDVCLGIWEGDHIVALAEMH